MLRGAVPFMVSKIVLGIPAVILDHQSIARHLGNDRGRRDGTRQSIAFDDGTLRNRKSGNCHGIQEKEIRRERQGLYSTPHRQPGRFEDIQTVDLSPARRSNADAHGPTNDFGEQANPLRFVDLLGIVQSNQITAAWQYDRSRDNGAGERPTSGLIETSNAPVPAASGLHLKFFRGAPGCRVRSANQTCASGLLSNGHQHERSIRPLRPQRFPPLPAWQRPVLCSRP